jgi:hypothetical protein
VIGADNADVYALLAGVSGALIVVIVALGIAVARTREQVARLQEWMRVHERRHELNSK